MTTKAKHPRTKKMQVHCTQRYLILLTQPVECEREETPLELLMQNENLNDSMEVVNLQAVLEECRKGMDT